MGASLCCCHSRGGVQFDEMELNEISGAIPTKDMPPVQQPQFKHTMTRDSNSGTLDTMHMITEMALCDEHTDELCPTTLRVISILSLYHQFIIDYDAMSINNDNIMDLIDQSFDDYLLPHFRDDVHHIQTYHESNAQYMMLLYMKLIEMNHELADPILDLSRITRAIVEDQEHRHYFGHKMLDEIAMIQLLNQIHDEFTNPFRSKYSHHSNDDDHDFVDEANNGLNGMHQYNANDNLIPSHPRSSTITHDHGLQMIDESDSSDQMDLGAGTVVAGRSVNHSVNTVNGVNTVNTKYADPPMNDDDDLDYDLDDDLEEDLDEFEDIGRDDIDQRGQHIGTAYDKTKRRTKRKKKGNKDKMSMTKSKKGYVQGVGGNHSINLDDDDDRDSYSDGDDGDRVKIDVRYEREKKKEHRKIGRLKLKKPKKRKNSNAKSKGKGKAKIVGDTSWVTQSPKKNVGKRHTESIMALRGTALVSKLSEELHTLAAEDEFAEELEAVNVDDEEVERLNVGGFEQTVKVTKMKKQRSAQKLLNQNGAGDTGIFDEKYEVDAV